MPSRRSRSVEFSSLTGAMRPRSRRIGSTCSTKSFVDAGGHQLQINALNRQTLLDAQAHPELHRNLIVRVWGWSAYFVELDKQYQDQIIQRVELVP